MNTNKFQRNIKGAVLALSMVFGFILLSGTVANAQWRDNRGGYGRNGGGSDRIAADNGYRDGLNRGSSDSYDRRRYNPQDTREYKKGTDGYSSRFGSKDQYKYAYREGFMRGYNEGYNRNGRNNGGRNNGRGGIFGRGW